MESESATVGYDGASVDEKFRARFHAQTLWLVVTVYPLYSLYLHIFQPQEYDEPIVRVCIGAFAAALLLLQALRPELRRHAALFAFIAVIAFTVHFQWLTYRASLSTVYMLGAAVVAAASAVIFDRTPYYVMYATVAVIGALTVAVCLRHVPIATMYFVMILTIQVVVYLSLSARFTALASLKAAREANLEMRKLLLEGELKTAQRKSQQFEALSLQDVVTGIPNRHYIDKQIHQAFERYHEERVAFTVLFIDLDKFKAVNDTLGHKAGDKVLVTAAQRIRASLRRADMVARHGGDEFVALLGGVETDEVIDRLCRGIVASVSEAIVVDDGAVAHIGASIGAAVCPRDATDYETLLHIADEKMYAIKKLRKAAR